MIMSKEKNSWKGRLRFGGKNKDLSLFEGKNENFGKEKFKNKLIKYVWGNFM